MLMGPLGTALNHNFLSKERARTRVSVSDGAGWQVPSLVPVVWRCRGGGLALQALTISRELAATIQ